MIDADVLLPYLIMEEKNMFKIRRKVRKGSGASIPEASADDPINKRGFAIGETNSSNISPNTAEPVSPQSNDQPNEEIIMNKQVNMTPQQMVEKLQKAFPDTEVRLSREGDPELSMVLINFYPLSSRSKTNTQPEQSLKQSPQENLVKELQDRGIKVNVFSKEALHRRKNDNLKKGEWPHE